MPEDDPIEVEKAKLQKWYDLLCNMKFTVLKQEIKKCLEDADE